MADKTINTRILLKYDTLANWNASTGILKAGEVAIATVPEGTAGQEVGSVTAPQVLVKVGNGNSTFAQLPFITAKAGDVYTWAKQNHPVYIKGTNAETGAPIYGDLSTEFLDVLARIAELEGFKDTNSNIGEQINNAIETALGKLDNNDAAVEHQFVTAAVQTDGKVVVSRAALVKEDIPTIDQTQVSGLGTALTEIDGRLDVIEGEGEGSVKKALADAKTHAEGLVTALEEGQVATNKTNIEALQEKVDTTGTVTAAIATAKQEAISAAAADATSKANTAEANAIAHADAEIAKITGSGAGSIGDLENRVKAIEDDYLVEADKTELANATKAVADDLGKEVTRATEVEADFEKRIAEMETFWEAADDPEGTIDKLAEIVNYIAADKDGALDMAADIKANTDDIATLKGNTETAGSVANTVATAIAPVNAAIEEEETRAKAAEEANAAAAKAADDKAVAAGEAAAKAQDEVDALEKVVGTPTEGKTIVEMIEAAQDAATYDDAEVRGLIAENTAAIGAEVDRATKAEAAIKAEIGVDENGNYLTLEGGHANVIAAVNAANTAAGANATAIEKLNGDATTEGSVAKAVADLKTELTEDIADAVNGRIKTITGDDYIKVDATDAENIKLTFDTTNIVFNCGTADFT